MTTVSVSKGERLQVVSALASMHAEPRISSAWTSQLLAGHVVEVLEVNGEWQRVRGEDGYEGWVHRGHLVQSTGDEKTWRLSLGCRVQEKGGQQRALPLLARISPAAEVVNGSFVDVEALGEYFPRTASAIARSAQTLFEGASYVWGGVSPWGCDCSGFVQSIFAIHGFALPRDASQQAVAVSSDPAIGIDDGGQASLAFFSDRDDRRITHVGVLLGDGRMAHSGLSRGGVVVEHLGDNSDEYVQTLRRNYVGLGNVVGS